MRIRTRIQLSALLAVLIAVSVAFVLILGMRAVERAIDRNDKVAESLNQIFELSMLTTDYLVHYEPRAERQWRAMHAELEHVLSGLALVSGADEPLLAHMRENSAEAYLLFDEITVAHERGTLGEVDPVISREYQARLAARLLVVMQSMVSDSVTLGERSSLEAITAQQRTFALVLAIALSGVSVMVVIGVSTNRTIVSPILVLRDSAREVGRGRLSTRSGIRSSDEVGELATAFDGMVAELQQSHTMLEHEVTDRRRAERELSEYRDHLEQLVEARTAELLALNDDLRQATRAKDDFMASMSHELRTPLNSIIGFTDIMLKRMAGDLTDEQERQLTMVLHSGQQLLSLIDDVLDLARLEAGRARIDVTSFHIAEAIGMLIDMMSPIAAGQRVALNWIVAEDAPEIISTDRGKLEQIMLNLLSNAVKFTHEGAVEVIVSARPDGSVAFEVRDTGIGIPASEVEAVFDHFHQARPDTSKIYAGTGLGLAISRRLAQAIGGTISVTSEVGVGSVFTLVLPPEPPEADVFVAEGDSTVVL